MFCALFKFSLNLCGALKIHKNLSSASNPIFPYFMLQTRVFSNFSGVVWPWLSITKAWWIESTFVESQRIAREDSVKHQINGPISALCHLLAEEYVLSQKAEEYIFLIYIFVHLNLRFETFGYGDWDINYEFYMNQPASEKSNKQNIVSMKSSNCRQVYINKY